MWNRGMVLPGAFLARMLLSALIVASALLGPIYARQSLSSVAREHVSSTPPEQKVMALQSQGGFVQPADLVKAVPAGVSRWFEPPVGSAQIAVSVWPNGNGAPFGHVVWRDRACDHLTVTAGRCPSAPGEIMVEQSIAAAQSWTLGSEILVARNSQDWKNPAQVARFAMHVVGTYRADDEPGYWVDTPLQTAQRSTSAYPLMGALLTVPETFEMDPVAVPGVPRQGWTVPDYRVDYTLAPSTAELDAILTAGPAVAAFQARPPRVGAGVYADGATPMQVRSHVPALAQDIAMGRSQVLLTVPFLAGGLTALVAAVFWLAVSASAASRRKDAGVARLRGHGRSGARRLILRDLMPSVLLGLPLGLLLAGAVAVATRTWWFVPRPELTLDRASIGVGLGVLVVPPLMTVAAARRVSREPVPALLRSVQTRTRSQRAGILEVMLATLAVGGFVLVVTGDLRGPAALVAPLLLALAAGLGMARLVTSYAARRGPVLLAQGRSTVGLALVRVGRRGVARFVVPVVCVAVALLVFSMSANAVASREYQRQALAEVGASAVLGVMPVRPDRFAAAVAAAEPTGRVATPVVRVVNTDPHAVPMLAVDSAHFKDVASMPPAVSDAAWRALAPSSTPPLMLTGSKLTVRFSAASMEPLDVLEVNLDYLTPDWVPKHVILATLPNSGKALDREASLPLDCAAGCRLVGFTFDAPARAYTDSNIHLELNVDTPTVDGRPISLGPADTWLGPAAATGSSVLLSDRPGGGFFARLNFGQRILVTHQGSVPVLLPALVTPPALDGKSATAANVVGLSMAQGTQPVQVVGVTAWAPGTTARAAIVDRRTASGAGWVNQATTEELVYVAGDDPAQLARLRAALTAAGLTVTQMRLASEVAQGYAHSAPGWSLRLSTLVAVLALLAAAAALGAVVGAGAGTTRRELAALRLQGATGRDALRVAGGELTPVVLAGALVGAVCGWAAAAVTLGSLPLFLRPPVPDVTEPTVPLTTGLLAATLAIAVLVAVCVVLARWLTRSTEPAVLVGGD